MHDFFSQHQHNNQNKLLNDMNTGMAVIDKFTFVYREKQKESKLYTYLQVQSIAFPD